MNTPAELAVRNGYIVTMDADRAVIPDGTVLVAGGRITEVGPAADVAVPGPATVIDADGGLVIPGLVDAHQHAGMFLSAFDRIGAGRYPTVAPPGLLHGGGDMDAISAVSCLTNFPGFATSPEATEVAALAACAEEIRSGVTCFSEGGGGSADAIARAVESSGLRAVVTSMAADLVTDGDEIRRANDVDELLAAQDDLIDRWHGSVDGRVRAGLNLFFVGACSDELLDGTEALSSAHDVQISTHVAALANEAEWSRRHHGRTGLERLADAGLFSSRLGCIHCGYPTAHDVQAMVGAGVHVVHCPTSTTVLPSGYVDRGMFPAMERAGVSLAIGNDTTWLGGSLVRQLNDASSIHKDRTMTNDPLDASTVFEMATLGGARFCGWADEIGSLEVGKAADLAIVDRSGFRYQPGREPVRRFVEVGEASDVTTVIVAGRVLMRDRQLLTIDVDDLMGRAEAVVEELERSSRPPSGR